MPKISALHDLFSFLLLITVVYSIRSSSRWQNRLPPGPRRFPLIGNALQMPRAHMERAFASWSEDYGDLIYTEFFGHRTIIINSQEIARELLERRGGKYSSRPRMVTIRELLGWDPIAATLPYRDENHRKQRRWIWSMYGEKKAVQKLDSLKERETCALLSGLMDTPDDYTLHIKRFVAGLVVESVYGHRITSLEDQYVTLMDEAMEATTATGAAGGTLVDMVPILKHVPAWMPGAAFKRAALHARELVWDSHHIPFRMAREAIASGSALPSFTSALLEKAEKAGRMEEEENVIRYGAGVVYAGATDTMKCVLLTFILAMVLHPGAYKKAQEEIDRVIGNSRLPTLDDRQDLPYIDCILKETYRWHVPAPLGLPHYTTEDDEYEGYHIPKDTSVMVNIWSICRDARFWDEPDVFRPERFLEADTQTLDPRNIVFGYGRRLCPGRLFGDTTLFLAIANMAATLDIRKVRDTEGREITPKASFLDSFISYPDEFLCTMVPRSSSARSLVAETMSSLFAE
ncbi:cytochrome P450 [Daedalea quercina L-15889]|uniref:Cytochrome P450 n=1 Tax=Daedalea quercina L-15889 TaxID=1314783 RepID=A0A165QEX0_9APHY|nr:cytochrome P450 [Daedalea quercina L-15889]